MRMVMRTWKVAVLHSVGTRVWSAVQIHPAGPGSISPFVGSIKPINSGVQLNPQSEYNGHSVLQGLSKIFVQ